MREIITLQLGSLANYTGTHLWNSQEEYFDYGGLNPNKSTELNHDVLYRAGETPSGAATYTPRVLIYELKGGFGSLQKYNRLFSGGNEYSDQDSYVQWDQGVNRIDRPVKKNRYQQELDRMEDEHDNTMDVDAIDHLDQSVNNWSDYNRIYYHPRSINQVTTHQMDDDINPFDNYTIGRQAYKENEKETDTFDENFRFFAEECDSLQGFQLLTNVDDAFGGFTEGLLNDIRDEYAKTPIITYGLSDSHAPFRTERIKQKIILNRALSMSRLSESSSLYVPIYTPTQKEIHRSGLAPYINVNDYSLYHTSAVIAAAIDTSTLPFRLKKNPITFADCVHRLNWVRSSKLASMSVSFPLPVYESGYTQTLESLNDDIRPMMSLLDVTTKSSPKKKVDVYGETVVTRGLPNTRENPSAYLEKLYSGLKDENDPLQFRYNISNAFPLPDSYPKLFTPNITPDGYVTSTPQDERVERIPLMTHFMSGSVLEATVSNQVNQLEKLDFKDFYEYSQGESGLTREDFIDTKESLMALLDCYE